MTWICDIPGATPVVSGLHFALHAGLAVFVVGGGLLFLALAVNAYRHPSDAALSRNDP